MHPLWRNRDFLLMQAGQFFSMLGGSLTTVAFPLLVLAISHSATQAGVVGFARILPFGLFSVLAGLAADTWSRKRLMILSDLVGAAAIATLSVVILTGDVAVWHIIVLGFVEGCGATLFNAAASGAMRSIVPVAQLPAAFSVNEARRSAQRLIGQPAGGALYALSHSVPFVLDAVSFLFSAFGLALTRTPFEEARERDLAPVRTRIADGFRFLWRQPFLRTSTFLYGIGNFLVPAMTLVLIVVAKRQGLTAGEIGLLTATLGIGSLFGSLFSPVSRRLLSVRAILLCELWTWSAAWLFLIWPNAYVLAACLVLFGAAAPVTDSVVMTLNLALTPDRLVSRVGGVRLNIALLVTPLGPLVAGALLGATSSRTTVALLATLGLGLALWGTLSPSIRSAPTLAELSAEPSSG